MRARDLSLTLQTAAVRTVLAATFRFLPYRSWRRLFLSSLQSSTPSQPDLAYSERVIHAILRTEDAAPGRCLPRAVTAWLFLRRHAVCRVRLGVALKKPGDPFAHASLELDGRVIFGETNQDEFATLEVGSAVEAALKNKRNPSL